MSNVGKSMERVHKLVASTVGEMSHALVRRRLLPVSVSVWADRLRRAAADLDKIREELE